MADARENLGRRDFLKAVGVAAGAAGLCPLLGSAAHGAATGSAAPAGSGAAAATGTAAKVALQQVPRRKLGKTGVEIPVLGIGSGTIDLARNPEILERALAWGLTYWDTSISYGGGEQGIGKALADHPELRKKLFINTKTADIATPKPVMADVERQFQSSLQRLKTDYVDMYMIVHAMRGPDQLIDELKPWAEEKKKKGQVKFVGFSCHDNMAENLMAAAKAGWVDACLFRCNFRDMKQPKMQEAIAACDKAGVGLIAIKAMGTGLNPNSPEDKKLSNFFTDKGYDEHQAKIKALLEEKRITAASVGMKTVDIVDSCAKAVIDNPKLSQADRAALDQYASATCDSYCAGCGQICAAALPDVGHVSDVMRYLMYHNSYGDREHARTLFARIPVSVRQRLALADYSVAEARCPQRIAIGRMMAEAMRVLA
jgi:uncharacterized protein